MANLGKLSTHLPKAYNLNPDGKRSTWDKIYAGYVRDNKDAQHQGRLKVFIPELCITDVADSWIICDYGSPFAGSTPAAAQNYNADSSQTSYGMWFVPPDNDNQVLVVFINGDPNKGVWIACLPHVVSHRMTPSYPGNSAPPSEAPIVAGASQSDEPAAAAPAVAVGTSEPAPATAAGGDSPAAPAQIRSGTDSIPALGNPTRSSHNSYDVGGIVTPGGNRLVMSDAAGETQIRLATRNNIQVILHNETGILSLMTGDGKSRVELHRDGTIFIYGEKNINIRSKQDVNLHGDRNVNIQAGNLVQIKGDNGMRLQTGSGRMHFYSGENIHMTSVGDHHRFSNGHIHDTSVNKIYRFSNYGILDTSNGDIQTFSWATITQNARDDINFKSGAKTRIESTASSIHIKAATTVNLFSSSDTNIKSDAQLNIQSKNTSNFLSGGDLNLDGKNIVNVRAQSGTLNLQAQDGNVNIAGGPIVVIGPTSIINAGVVPAAGGAAEAGDAEPSVQAEIVDENKISVQALTPDSKNFVDNLPDSAGATSTRGGGGGGGGGRGGTGQTVTSSITSQMPGPEPDQNRFVGGPGYSNTNTIEIDETLAENVRIGQISVNQATPLQTIGFVGSGATQGESGVESNNLGLNPLIYEAVVAIQQTYPRAKRTSTVRRGDTGQHGSGNAVDFVLEALSQTERASLLTEIATGIRSGAGPYRFIRGVGMYDVTGRLLHIDSRPTNSSGVRNGMDAWGPTYSVASAVPGQVPNYFLSAFQISGRQIGIVPGNPRSQVPAQPGQPVSANSEPLRWIGTAYESTGAPRYRQEPVPDYIFKSASEWSLTDVGLADIKNFETLRGPRPADITGKQFRNVCDNTDMIGYGHKLTDQEKQDKKITIEGTAVDISNLISEDDAFKLLKQDVKAAETAVKTGITTPITQQQFDVLVDFCWNIGEEKFKASNLFKLVNERKYNYVTTEFIKWCKACGIVRAELQSRRRANALKWSGIMRPETPVAVSSAAAGGASPPASASQKEREQFALNYFIGQGWSREQAAGIVGNLVQESNGLTTTAVNGAENAQGIAQWTPNGGRQTRVAQYLGKPITQATLAEQLGAVHWELRNSESRAGDRLRSAVTDEQAATVVDHYYERSDRRSTSTRIAIANRVLSDSR